MMHKIASKMHKSQKAEEIPQIPLQASIYRFRKQRGVNLGSWFVLERWLTDEPFHHASPPAKSDLDVARGQNARLVLEKHYDTWITESDWKWIAERGLNAVRIPIGYYHLCGADPSVLLGTDFADFRDVFSGVWSRLIQAIETAQRFRLGVLLDLHAAPGKQNQDSHSGTSNPPAFFNDRRHREHTAHVLRTLVTHLNAHKPPLLNIVGIELLNEPNPTSDAELKDWYSTVITDLAALSPGLPIYLSDSWKTEQYAEYIKSYSSNSSLLVLDHHLYRCFTQSDISTKAPEHTRALTDAGAPTPRLLARISEMLESAGAGLIVGEWSGALNPRSLTGGEDTKNYVAAQLQLYEAHCAGYFFWTYKKQGQDPDRGWCLRDAVEGGAFPQRVGLSVSRNVESVPEHGRQVQVRDQLKDQALGQHVAYWSKHPGKYHHARFADGFALGWDDAYTFLKDNSSLGSAVSELGFVGAFARTKTTDHGPSFWEFHHGFKQGVAAARSDFLRNYC